MKELNAKKSETAKGGIPTTSVSSFDKNPVKDMIDTIAHPTVKKDGVNDIGMPIVNPILTPEIKKDGVPVTRAPESGVTPTIVRSGKSNGMPTFLSDVKSRVKDKEPTKKEKKLPEMPTTAFDSDKKYGDFGE